MDFQSKLLFGVSEGKQNIFMTNFTHWEHTLGPYLSKEHDANRRKMK